MEAIMRNVFKYAAAATLTGALALSFAAPSQAEGGRNAAAAVGFVAGAAVGAAATNAAYNNGYYYGDDYAYEPAYVEPAPVYVEPAPVYVAPAYSYDSYYPNRWQDQHSTNNFSISSQR
jgi:PXPV repeat-containing protein